MYEGSDLFVEKITVNDFNDRLVEIFATTKSKKEHDSIREKIQKIIMQQLIHLQHRWYMTNFQRLQQHMQPKLRILWVLTI